MNYEFFYATGTARMFDWIEPEQAFWDFNKKTGCVSSLNSGRRFSICMD